MRKLDFNKINNRLSGSISNRDSLEKISPMNWPESVLTGEKRVTANSIKGTNDKCAKLEISYL